MKWTVNKTGKPVITLSVKKKKSVTVRGKKAGTATVTAKLTLKGNKTKTLKAKVKVNAKEKSGNVTVVNKRQNAFPRNLKVSLTETGYVKLQWDRAAGAHAYVIQRKTGTEDWKELKVTASLTFTDTTVNENTAYQYRVRANCDGMCTAFSDAVTVTTGKIGNNSSKDPVPTTEPSTVPEETPVPDQEPTKTPGDEPKYEYEIQILNEERYTLYNNMTVLLYIKTNNPNESSFRVDCGSGKYVYHEEGYYTYEDEFFSVTPVGGYSNIHYKESSNDSAVKGGYIEGYTWQTPGIKNIVIQEKIGNSWVNTDAKLVLDLKDYNKTENDWVKEVIQEVTNDDMTSYEKMCLLSNYLMKTFKYPSIVSGTESNMNKSVVLTTECCGCYWDTKRIDCVVATNIVGLFADELGLNWEVVSYSGGYFEAENCGGAYAGASHVNNKVYIDGKAYIFDGCPNANDSIIPDNSWDYIL